MAHPRKRETIDQNLVRALAHPLRVEILEILNEETASPNQVKDALDRPLGNVSYHTNVLFDCGCIELVGRKSKRGALEHFYRAVPRSFIGHPAWRKVPRSLRGSVTAAALSTFMDKAIAALEAGKLEAREDSSPSWFSIGVDEVGWAQATEIIEAATDQLQVVDEQSRERAAITGQPLIPAVVALALFEAANKRRKKRTPE